MLKQRVITASILAILFLAALFMLPAIAWSVLVACIVMQGAWEWSKLAKMRGSTLWLFLTLMLVSYVALLWMWQNFLPAQKNQIQMLVYGVSFVFWVLLVPLWLKGIWKSQNPLMLAVVGWIVLIPTGLAMLDLRAANPQAWWLLGVMGLVWMADISAYFAGRKFGKNKLAPSVSPGKTWEGVAGAMLGVTVYMLVVMAYSDMTQHFSLYILAIFGVAFSVIGDLFESAIKRQAGVKDSGALLPGHGGLLDRIDALTSTLPLAAFALILMRFI
jgi:phosphatidate cytidylyltransferase